MKRLALLPLAVLFVVAIVAGCQDLQKNQKNQVQPQGEITVPSPSAASLSVAETGDASTGRSTVCVAYDNQLSRAQAEGDAQSVSSLETIIADACN